MAAFAAAAKRGLFSFLSWCGFFRGKKKDSEFSRLNAEMLLSGTKREEFFSRQGQEAPKYKDRDSGPSPPPAVGGAQLPCRIDPRKGLGQSPLPGQELVERIRQNPEVLFSF